MADPLILLIVKEIFVEITAIRPLVNKIAIILCSLLILRYVKSHEKVSTAEEVLDMWSGM